MFMSNCSKCYNKFSPFAASKVRKNSPRARSIAKRSSNAQHTGSKLPIKDYYFYHAFFAIDTDSELFALNNHYN